MRSISIYRHPVLSVALGSTLLWSGCDKEDPATSGKDSKSAKAPAGDAKAGDAKAGDAKAGDAKAGDTKAGALAPEHAENAALQAELDATEEQREAAKELDPKAAAELDEPITPEDAIAHEKTLVDGEKGPVSIANVTLTEKKAPAGRKGVRMEVAADVTVNEIKNGGVYTKASCLMGDQVFVNVGTLSNKFGPLAKMKAGEKKRLDTRLFGISGLPQKPSRCQLSFDYGAPKFSARIADVCWDGGTVTDGPCAEALAPAPKGDGKIVPFDFVVEPHKAMGGGPPGATALHVSFGARFNEHIEKAPHLHTKTACKVGDRVWVEVSPDLPHVKPFSLEHGEAVMVHHNQFFMNALPAAPEACNIEVLLDAGWGKADEKLAEVCSKASAITEGPCEFHTASADPPGPMASDSISIDELALAWHHDWGDEKKVVLSARLAATVHKGISERVQLTAQASCEGQKKDEEHHIGPDLEYVGPGETVGVNFASFRDPPLDKPAARCTIEFGAAPFMTHDTPTPIGSFCLSGESIIEGKCKGKGKAKVKAAAVDKEVSFTRAPAGG